MVDVAPLQISVTPGGIEARSAVKDPMVVDDQNVPSLHAVLDLAGGIIESFGHPAAAPVEDVEPVGLEQRREIEAGREAELSK